MALLAELEPLIVRGIGVSADSTRVFITQHPGFISALLARYGVSAVVALVSIVAPFLLPFVRDSGNRADPGDYDPISPDPHPFVPNHPRVLPPPPPPIVSGPPPRNSGIPGFLNPHPRPPQPGPRPAPPPSPPPFVPSNPIPIPRPSPAPWIRKPAPSPRSDLNRLLNVWRKASLHQRRRLLELYPWLRAYVQSHDLLPPLPLGTRKK